MAYCALADVVAQNPKRDYGAGTKPTQTQVEGYIDRISDEIDTVLKARGLTTPITSPTEFADHLKQLNAYGAAALAEMAMFPESVGPASTPHGWQLWKMYREGVKALREGALPVALDSDAGPRSLFTDHPVTEPTEDQEWRKPKFGKDKVF